MELNHLEARVAAATETLAGRKTQVSELESFARRLETEIHSVTKERDRLHEELEGAGDQLAGLSAKNEQLAGENKRLISENSRFRSELQRLEGTTNELREERGRLTRLLGALIDSIEKNTEMPAELVQENRPKADVVEIMRKVNADKVEDREGADGHDDADDHDGANGHEAAELIEIEATDEDDDGDIPNEAARRLMDRIRDRIEAHRA